MSERAEVAIVTLMFIDGMANDETDVQMQATAVTWGIEDASAARTLKEQLCGLLGEPAAESLMPWTAKSVLDEMTNPWPGAVHLNAGKP